MKRYQCIKNYSMDEKAHQMPGEIAFKAGKIYPCKSHLNGCFTFESEISPYHSLFEDTVKEYFQELLDLNVDDVDSVYAEQEHLEYVYMQQSPGCTRKGLAIIAIFILTVLALIFFR